MAAAGARAQKPVGSAAWISTEKENCTQLVDQEMEEIEFPVRYEMEWLDEHMGEIFSNNQFNFTDAFKTPGKLRGKTPRTLRKRDPTENRVPLSEIFSSVKKNRADTKFSPSPAVQRSPTKAINSPSAPTSSTQGKSKAAGSTQPQYPELPQNINSFSQYNTDYGYHGMQDDNDDDDDDDDEVVLTQVAPESQLSTQPFDGEPITGNGEARRSSVGRRTTDASFHSAREDVRHRGDTVEPMNIDAPKQPRKEDTNAAEPAENDEPKEDAIMEDRPANEPEAASAPDGREADLPVNDAGPSPVKTTSAQRVSLQEDKEPEKNDPEKDEMALDNLDDIGSPSDADSPERPPIRKSSLSFASLPAREPLGSKPLGGSRLSRTSNLDSIKPTTAAGSNYFGRQTGHRMTQAVDENPQAEKMDVDESKPTTNEESDVDSKATKLHNKSSTQRLHEKISMLGKMQPSRPTKSIPAVANLSSAPVLYPELPAAQPEAKPEASSSKQRENTPPRSTPNADEDWIKPMSSPFQPYPSTAKATTSKPSGPPTSDAPEQPSSPLKSAATQGTTRTHVRQTSEIPRGKSATPAFSSPQRYGHQKSASVNIDNKMTTTPIGSPHRQDGPLSASKSRLQSIVRSAKGLFTSSGGVSAAARQEASSPDEPRTQPQRAHTDIERTSQRPLSAHSPLRQEGRRTRSSTEREEKRKQQEIDERKREEEVLAAEKTRQEEKLRTTQQKATRERARTESEARGPATYPTLPSSPIRATQMKSSKDPEPPAEAAPKAATQPSAPQSTRPNDRRPTKPTREPQQKPKPQPVSIRVGSALSRQMPLASSMASTSESSIPAPVPTPSTTKAASVKKKASNQSLHTASSNSSFKSSVSSQTQTQRKAQLASERKREQEEREARRKEDQRREMERKRAAQQSRAEAERRERQAEDPKKTAQMQAIEKRRLENARRLERQGSQQPETGPSHSDKTASQASQRETAGPNRPTSRLGSVLGRAINPPVPNPAKPPKRGLEEEQASHRAAAAKPGAMQPSGETKRRRTDDEENHAAMRPTMAPPIRQSNIRKEPAKKPSMYGNGQNAQAGSSIFKTGQPQRPGHPMDMAKYASGKIPFAESSNAAGPSQAHRTPGASSSKAPKQSPNYPNGENISLPEIATDSEDEDSEAEMLPVPNWAQPKELETLLRDQEGMEVDSIFGPIAPFSLEETFKADKRIKKFRDRTSSANWAGPDGLTQDEIRKDVAERQRLRMNGGWTFGM